MYDYIAFTDGSSKPHPTIKDDDNNPIWIGGAGVIILDLKTKNQYEKSETLIRSTNNHSELFAVDMSMSMIGKITKKKDEVKLLVISDSEYACNGLGTLVHKWAKGKKRTDNWKNATGVLCNQDMIKRIYYNFLKDSKYDIDFLHMNSHKKKTSEKDVLYMQEKIRKQGYIMDADTVKTLIHYNSEVDKLANNAMELGLQQEVI